MNIPSPAEKLLLEDRVPLMLNILSEFTSISIATIDVTVGTSPSLSALSPVLVLGPLAFQILRVALLSYNALLLPPDSFSPVIRHAVKSASTGITAAIAL